MNELNQAEFAKLVAAAIYVGIGPVEHGKNFDRIMAHDAAMRAQLAACEKELPDTWYVDKPLGKRLAMLITQWQKALRINTELEQQLAAVTKERDEWKRLYAHRGEALKRACLQCGYTQKEMKHHG